MDNDFATGYALGADSGSGKRDDGMLGGDGSWIFAFLIIALIFGGNGFGGFGGKAGGQGGADTRAAISDGFALNGLENGIRGIQNGLCDGFYAMNTGMLTGFNGIQSQMFAQSAQSQACCCETQRLIERGFADCNGFQLSPGAKKAIDAYEAAKNPPVLPADPPEPPAPEDKLGQILQSSAEILPDLRDNG